MVPAIQRVVSSTDPEQELSLVSFSELEWMIPVFQRMVTELKRMVPVIQRVVSSSDPVQEL
jgi:hypothetical protein